MLQRFLQIYDLQRNGTSFETPEELLSAVNLYALTQQSLRGYLEVGVGPG